MREASYDNYIRELITGGIKIPSSRIRALSCGLPSVDIESLLTIFENIKSLISSL